MQKRNKGLGGLVRSKLVSNTVDLDDNEFRCTFYYWKLLLLFYNCYHSLSLLLFIYFYLIFIFNFSILFFVFHIHTHFFLIFFHISLYKNIGMQVQRSVSFSNCWFCPGRFFFLKHGQPERRARTDTQRFFGKYYNNGKWSKTNTWKKER